MRLLELILVVLAIGVFLWFVVSKTKKQKMIVIGLAALYIVAVLHVMVEGPRWQMVFAYLVPFLLTIGMLFRKQGRRQNRLLRWGGYGLAAVYGLVMVATPLLLPVFSFEKPTGKYPVGTETFYLKDENREDAPTIAGGRELMVQVWYPSENQQGNRAPYTKDVGPITKGLEQALSIPSWVLSHLRYVDTYATEGSQVSEKADTYPVIVFSHGMTGFRNQNTFQVEELASHGYIVVGIDHAFDAAATVYPDGRSVLLSENQLTGFEQLDAHMDIWVKDISFVLDELEKWNRSGTEGDFEGKLDLEKIGMFGHSYGGAAAAQMLARDSRVKVALNMDGTLYGSEPPANGFAKPYLQMNGEKSIDKAAFDAKLDQAVAQTGKSRASYEAFWDESQTRRETALHGGGYTMTIPHTSHMSFTDFHLFSPLLENKGEQIEEVHHLINDVSIAFFDEYLAGKATGLLQEQANKHPEVGLEAPFAP
ncbi:carboxylic ester hydrolase [Shouchella clausii]|uniref:Carboxylic ester hydrolase n=1 Tax=Shouchella clausii TaxID=79880 RepID=A0A268P0D5_SHOCL|nr:carboxylic ester hydrolase [Shouchella clausii]PAE89216.1 carboxylic ester hydrolase [Shouchella clausii]